MAVTLHGNSDTTRDPKETTSTTIHYTGFQNPDGTPNEKAEQIFQDNYAKPTYKTYGVDPDTHEYTGTLTDTLQVDPEVVKSRNNEKIKDEENKQKASNFFVLGSHLIDAIGGLGGANIQQHNFPQVNAAENIKYLQSLNDAQDMLAAKDKQAKAAEKRAIEQAAERDVQAKRERFAEKYGFSITTSNISGGDSHTKTNREEQPRVGRSSSSRSTASGSAAPRNTLVKVVDKEGKTRRVYVNTAVAKQYQEEFKSYMTPLLDQTMPGTDKTYYDYLKGLNVIQETEHTSESAGGTGLRSSARTTTSNVGGWKWNDNQIMSAAYNWNTNDMNNLIDWVLQNADYDSNEAAPRQSAEGTQTNTPPYKKGGKGKGKTSGGNKPPYKK